MVGDLVTEEGGLEVLRDRTRDVTSRLQSVSIVMAGDYISSGVGRSELAGLGHSTDGTIGDAVMAVSCDPDDFSRSVSDSINTYSATENDAAMTFQQTTHGGPVVTMDGLRRKMKKQ